MSKPKIGFIGLGLMGGNMVENLQNRGFELVVMDLNKDAVADVLARGNAIEAASPKALAEASDIVMLCLTTSDVVEGVVYGDNGILAGIKEGAVVINFGTSIPASTRKIGADLAAKGAGMVDAPLGRTPAHAKDGLLNIMAAGDTASFEKVKPVLEQQGENVFYLGALGAGHVTKLINNFMGMTTVCAMSQAFAVADRAGVDRGLLYDIMSTGPSNSPFMGFCKNYAVDGVSDLGFSINNAGGLVARKTIAEMDLEHWNHVMTLNLTSVFMMTKACLTHMKTGAIVNIASQAGRDGGGAGAVPYATSKGAVMTMTRGLAKDVGPDIRVNALCPGMIDTDFHNIHTPDAGRRGFEANAPLKRQGHVDDAANLVLFLACDDSAFITGANIDINGGMLFS